jgi:hypothetical protein
MTKIRAKDITLLAVSSIKISETILALQKSSENMIFDNIKLVSHERPIGLPEQIKYEYCPPIKNINEYNYYIFKKLTEHIDTKFCLLIQYHAYIVDYTLFNNFWLDYDYIGAPWVYSNTAYITDEGEHISVGNGGFSLRSKQLMDLPRKMGWELQERRGFYNEDGNLTVYRRREMLDLGIKYAPVEVAAKFSYENPVPENGYGTLPHFGFHRNRSRWMIKNGY